MSRHTKEPWSVYPDEKAVLFGRLLDCYFESIGSCYGRNRNNPTGRANAARIVACVNACEGMEDPAAEIQALKDAANLTIRLAQQRDKLLEALERFCILNKNHYADIAGFIEHAKEVCSKVKGRGHE